MDQRRIRFAELLALLGGALLLAALSLPWDQPDAVRRVGWSALTGSLVPFVACAVIALYLFAITLNRRAPTLPVAAAVWTTLLGLIATIVAIVHVAAPAAPLCYGAWLGLAACVLVAVAGWLAMRDESPLRGTRATDPAA